MFFNFCNHWSISDLWRIFKPFGDLRDIYLAGKRLRSGYKFAFARFHGVGDVNNLLRQLETVKFDGRSIRVFLATNRNPNGAGITRNNGGENKLKVNSVWMPKAAPMVKAGPRGDFPDLKEAYGVSRQNPIPGLRHDSS
ncbi:uncharacterized protein [Rutidosis leptorrhynchoides]|uniref:uncharacterized protein n=1 Tax=Rutidosis leptorrhynchoides TaxID=125765 RepID=UPI003A992F1D